MIPLVLGGDWISPSGSLADYLQDLHPLGVLLFSRNIKEAPQVRELTAMIHECGNPPPLTCLDQEGGVVNRLSELGFSFPPLGDLEPDEVYGFSKNMGETLVDLGIDWNFAPVVDLGPSIPGTGLEGRLLGSSVEEIGARAQPFIRAMSECGILTCAKHFPGLGRAKSDTHHTLPTVEGRLDLDVEVFSSFLECPSWMVAHAHYRSFDVEVIPASLSLNVVQKARTMGYEGLLISDDMAMGAVTQWGKLSDLTKKTMEAGIDAVIQSQLDRDGSFLRDLFWERFPEKCAKVDQWFQNAKLAS